jgi:hypothetical protein
VALARRRTTILIALIIVAAVVGIALWPPVNPDPDRGLISWWKANGNAADSIGSNNGTINGSVTYAEGVSGRAFAFNGSHGFVAMPTERVPVRGADRTLELWFLLNALQVASNQVWLFFAGYGEIGTVSGLYAVAYSGDGQLFFTSWGESIQRHAPLTINKWHHVVVTTRDRHTQLFLDAKELEHSKDPWIDTIPGTTLFIGGLPEEALNRGRQQWSREFSVQALNGRIDAIRLYSRAMAAAEVRRRYEAEHQ